MVEVAKPKILVTGSTGMLGSHVFKFASDLADYEIHAIGRSNLQNLKNFIACDLTNLSQFESTIDRLRPDFVIHCAANVNVNGCETDRSRTYDLHVGTSSILASSQFVRQVIFVSTDSVFNGKKGDYKPGDEKNPLNYYAISKSLAEDQFINSNGNSIILRTNIFGFNTPLKSSLFEWAYRALKNQEVISGFTNVFFNPLYVKSLAKFIVDSILAKPINPGIYHFGSADFISKFDFINLVASVFNFDPSLIKPTVANHEIGGVTRALNTTLNTAGTQQKLGLKFPTVKEDLIGLHNDINHG
jgi:dTDP-4-dehydrorhamnose reductase